MRLVLPFKLANSDQYFGMQNREVEENICTDQRIVHLLTDRNFYALQLYFKCQYPNHPQPSLEDWENRARVVTLKEIISERYSNTWMTL